MTGVSSGQQFNDPSFLAAQQQNQPFDEVQVTTGPGGGTVTPSTIAGQDPTIFQSTAQGFAKPSQDVKVTGNMAAPSLATPLTTTPLSVDPQDLINSMQQLSSLANSTLYDPTVTAQNYASYAAGGMAPTTTTTSSPVDSGITMAAPSDLESTTQATVYNALLKYTGLSSQSSTYSTVLNQIAGQIATQNASGPIAQLTSGNSTEIGNYLTGLLTSQSTNLSSLSPTELSTLKLSLSNASTTISADEYTSGLTSNNQADVYNALVSFTGVNQNTNLSADQQKEFTAQLETLAANIAAANSSGNPPPALTSYNSSDISSYLLSQLTISSLPQTAQTAFQGIINEASTEISSVNAASGNPPPESADMQGMQSTNTADVLASMQTMLGMTSTQMAAIPELSTLAATIAAKNAAGGSGLDITNASSLQAALIALLGTSYSDTDTALDNAITSLATAYAAQNTTYYTALAQSTNQSVVLNALIHLSNINNNPNLTPAEKQTDINYLTAMASALAFMSKIRASVAMLDAQLRLQESQGKLSTIQDETKAAQASYTAGLSQIQTQLQSMLNSIHMAALMKILGPVIIAIVTIISVIVIVFSYGTAAPVMAAVLASVVVAVAILAIADMETNCLHELAKDLGITSKAGQDAFVAALQAIMQAIMIVFTLGLAAPLVAAETAAEVTVETVIEQVATLATKSFALFGIGQGLDILMSSGLLSDGFVAMFQAAGMSEADANTAAMVMVMVVAVATLIVSVKALGGEAAKAGADAADDALSQATADSKSATAVSRNAEIDISADADDAANAAQNASQANKAADDASTASNSATSAVGDAGDAADITADAAESPDNPVTLLAKKLARRFAESAKETATTPQGILKIMQALGSLGEAGSSIANAIGNIQQGKLSQAQAILTMATAQTQALLTELQATVQTFDMTQKDLDATSNDALKLFEGMVQVFADACQSAGTIVANTTATSS